MKKIFIILSLLSLNCSMLCSQYRPDIPNIPTNNYSNNYGFTDPNTLSQFDPLARYIRHLDIDNVISDLTKSGSVDEFRQKQALNFLANEISFWENRKNAVWKSPDLFFSLAGIASGIFGLFSLHRYLVNQELLENDNFVNHKGDYLCKGDSWTYCKYNPKNRDREYCCYRCEPWNKAKFYDLDWYETQFCKYAGISLPILGYLLFKWAKKCPFANLKLKKLQNIEYVVKLLSNK